MTRTILSPRAKAAAILGVQALSLLLFGFLIPRDSPLYPRCLFHQVTGLWCPGCGTGRGLYRIIYGDILGGLKQNILLWVGIPLLALYDLKLCLALFGKKPLLDPDRLKAGWGRKASIASAIVISLYWILRNIPAWPFSLLAPQAL